MNRLLSPNEAKFWLLDRAAPMNCVIVVQRLAPASIEPPAPVEFALPTARIGRQLRPRWDVTDRQGLIRRQTVEHETAWLDGAQAMLDERVGTDDQPPWSALLQTFPGGATLLLAVNHALTDWRTSLQVVTGFLAGTPAGEHAPACEELLPDSQFGDPAAADLIEAWWQGRVATRWEALGLDRLTRFLPPVKRTKLGLARLSPDETARLHARCADEGAALSSVVAVALRDVMAVTSVAHAVDMARFIRPAPAPGPGLAISHIFADLQPGEFWEAVREHRTAIFAEIRAGAAGDALLALPRLLLGTAPGAPSYRPAAVTITSAPTVGPRDAASDAGSDETMRLVVSSARGGGSVLMLAHHAGCLQLVAGWPEDEAAMPLDAVVGRLLEAASGP